MSTVLLMTHNAWLLVSSPSTPSVQVSPSAPSVSLLLIRQVGGRSGLHFFGFSCFWAGASYSAHPPVQSFLPTAAFGALRSFAHLLCLLLYFLLLLHYSKF